mgnify:CR=1 FL=1
MSNQPYHSNPTTGVRHFQPQPVDVERRILPPARRVGLGLGRRVRETQGGGRPHFAAAGADCATVAGAAFVATGFAALFTFLT